MRKFLTAVDTNPVNAHLNIISLGFTPSEMKILLKEMPLSTNDLLLENMDMSVLKALG